MDEKTIKCLTSLSTDVCYRICSNMLEDKERYPLCFNYRVDKKMIPALADNPYTKPIVDNISLFEDLVSEKIYERIRYLVDEGFGYIDEDENFVPENLDEDE